MSGGGQARFRALRLPLSGARVDGPILRGRGLAAGRPHDLDWFPIDASVPQLFSRRASICRSEKVRLIYLEGSGCYGQNAHEDACADAVILSRAVGSPVRVQWMRQDEHGWDPKGPPQPVDIRVGTDAQGNIAAWETETWIPMWINAKGTIPLVGLDAAGIKQRQGRWPGSLDENLDPPYTSPNASVVIHRLKDSPLRPGHVRAPGKVANVWAVETWWMNSPPRPAKTPSRTASTG